VEAAAVQVLRVAVQAQRVVWVETIGKPKYLVGKHH
jgi:hypothetical protein